jgi:hypothetical protein
VSNCTRLVHAKGTLQRLFTMFPAGLPGVALVLLRIAVAIATVLADPHAPHWRMALSGLSILALCLGGLTPIFTALSLGLQSVGWAVVGGYPAMRLLASLVTVALLLLGPGAYSFDARRFGRKLMTFPGEDPPSDD